MIMALHRLELGSFSAKFARRRPVNKNSSILFFFFKVGLAYIAQKTTYSHESRCRQ